MSPAERNLLQHRLREMAREHERAEEADHYADAADTLSVAMARDGVLCAELLREAAAALGPAA